MLSFDLLHAIRRLCMLFGEEDKGIGPEDVRFIINLSNEDIEIFDEYVDFHEAEFLEKGVVSNRLIEKLKGE